MSPFDLYRPLLGAGIPDARSILLSFDEYIHHLFYDEALASTLEIIPGFEIEYPN